MPDLDKTNDILVMGAGRIGVAIARRLSTGRRDEMRLADSSEAALLWARMSGVPCETVVADVGSSGFSDLLSRHAVVVSALPVPHNVTVAKAAAEAGCSYFDLTEDVPTTEAVRAMAACARDGQVFVPQCGLAPGLVSIYAAQLMREFKRVVSVKVRVGALPRVATNRLGYALTWSPEGLVNEYCNDCNAIRGGELVRVPALGGIEELVVDGVRYEAFNTSGGLGGLERMGLEMGVDSMDYKTIRYPGHRDLVRFLLDDMGMRGDREDLARRLGSALPGTTDDVVLFVCEVTGETSGRTTQRTVAMKWRSEAGLVGPQETAIQATTASSAAAMVELYMNGKFGTGFVRHEDVSLEDFVGTRNWAGMHVKGGGNDAFPLVGVLSADAGRKILEGLAWDTPGFEAP